MQNGPKSNTVHFVLKHCVFQELWFDENGVICDELLCILYLKIKIYR